MKKHCLALDLIDDSKRIESYKKYHKNVWPEIEKSIKDAGVESMEIYLLGNRLFMIIEVNNTFSFEKWELINTATPKCQEWETLMWNYQQALPIAKKGEKWLLMDQIYQLKRTVV